MNKLLATLDGIEQGTIKGSAQKETGAMKKILESFNKVQVAECGTMPGAMGGMPQREGSPVSMNISLNASGKENVDELMSLLKSAGLDGAALTKSMPMPAPARSMPMALAMDTAEMEEEGFSNSPDEKYSDTEYMTKDLAGGINRQKKMYKPAAKGDNPMAVESIKERLWAALNEKKAKPDFLDMDKDGNKKEPMKKAVADKKAGPKKVSEKFDPLKHVKNPTPGEKTAAKDVKRGSYADRAAMLKSAEADGRLKDQKVKEEKSSTGGEIDRSKKGVTKHTENPKRYSDEPHAEPKSQAKSKSAAEKKGAPEQKKSKTGTWGVEGGKKFDNTKK